MEWHLAALQTVLVNELLFFVLLHILQVLYLQNLSCHLVCIITNGIASSVCCRRLADGALGSGSAFRGVG